MQLWYVQSCVAVPAVGETCITCLYCVLNFKLWRRLRKGARCTRGWACRRTRGNVAASV